MHDLHDDLPAFMTGIRKEAGVNFQLATRLKNGWGAVRNFMKGAKSSPAPINVGTKASVQVPHPTPHPTPANTPTAAPGWWDRAKQVGGAASNTINAVTTPLFAYGMVRDMWGGSGEQPQQAEPVDQGMSQGYPPAMDYRPGMQPGYYGGYDPRNEPMQGNIGDWFRGVFTRGRNPALEQQYQQQVAELNQRAAQMAGRG